MVEVSVWDELKPVKLKKTALKFAPQIEASGLNLIGRFSDDKKAEIVAEVCHSTFYYVRSAPGVPEAESWRNLIRQEAFILLEPQDSEEFAVFVKSQISAAAFPNFCLYYDFRKLILLLDKLLKLEVKESTLSRLLLGNLQESLKQQNKFKITDGQ